MDALLGQGRSRIHTLANPGLAYASDRIRFVNPPVDWDSFIDVRVTRLVRTTHERVEAFARMLESFPMGLECFLPTNGPRLFCERYNRLWNAHSVYSLPVGQTPLAAQIQSYDLLRQEGVVAPDPEFLDRAAIRLMESSAGDRQGTLDAVFTIFVKDGLMDQAESTLSALAERGLITPDYHDGMLNQLLAGRKARDRFVNSILGD